jgi:hypothetical protein
MPSKLQKERSKNTAMMIDEREGLLPSSKVGDDCGKKRTPKASKRGSNFVPYHC